MERVPITKAWLERLREELTRLKKKDMPEVVKAIGVAREFGDISENAEYHAAKERQGLIMAKINDLEEKIGRAQVLEPLPPEGKVYFGHTVTVYDVEKDVEFSYTIVGPWESDTDKGEISMSSPIGQALLGREEGDEIRVQTPKGSRVLEIVEIK